MPRTEPKCYCTLENIPTFTDAAILRGGSGYKAVRKGRQRALCPYRLHTGALRRWEAGEAGMYALTSSIVYYVTLMRRIICGARSTFEFSCTTARLGIGCSSSSQSRISLVCKSFNSASIWAISGNTENDSAKK